MNTIKIKIKGKNRIGKLGLGFIERTLKAEDPEGADITKVSSARLIYHSLAYADEREGKQPELTVHDVFDFLDEVGLHADEVVNFQIKFFESLKVHLPDKESKKAVDDLAKELKKSLKSSTKKTGKKTS